MRASAPEPSPAARLLAQPTKLVETRPQTPAAVRDHRRQEVGFTAVELVTTLAIVSAVMVGAVTALGSTMANLRIRSAAASIAASLRAARALAILNRAEMTVPFDPARRRYTIASGKTTAGSVRELDAGIVRRMVLLPPDVDFARPTAETAVTLTRPASSELVAVFDWRGRLRSGTMPGCAYLGNTRDTFYRVCANLVGTVKVERWDGRGWR